VPDYSFLITIGPIIFFAIFVYVYSYWIYRKIGVKRKISKK
jgi:hypothetical protein